jgi:hypothetical protein
LLAVATLLAVLDALEEAFELETELGAELLTTDDLELEELTGATLELLLFTLETTLLTELELAPTIP